MVLLLAALTTGCDPPGKPNPADRPLLPDQVVSFDQLFATNCVGCHGVNGKRGPAPPLNNPLFVAIMPKDDLLNVIRHGRSGTPMPPFAQEWGGTLTDEQIATLAAWAKGGAPEGAAGDLKVKPVSYTHLRAHETDS